MLSQLQNMTGLATLYDLAKQRDYATDAVGTFLNRAEGKTALGVEWRGRSIATWWPRRRTAT